MNHKKLFLSFLVLAAVVLVVFLLTTRAGTGQAQGILPGNEITANPDWVTCTIFELGVFPDRVHVRCTEPVILEEQVAVYFFAASSGQANALHTNRMLTLLNTAFALGKPVYLWFDPVSISNPAGCEVIDCRLLKAVILPATVPIQ